MNDKCLPPGYSSPEQLPMKSRICYGVLSSMLVFLCLAILSAAVGLVFLGGDILARPSYSHEEFIDAIFYIIGGIILALSTLIGWGCVAYWGMVRHLFEPKMTRYGRVHSLEDVEYLLEQP